MTRRQRRMQRILSQARVRLNRIARHRVNAGVLCPYCKRRPVDNTGKSCTECDDMLVNCDPGRT